MARSASTTRSRIRRESGRPWPRSSHRADAILTDDRAFLALLVRASPPIPVLVPTAAIVALVEGGKMSVAEAKAALGKIEHSVRAEAYEAAIQELEKLDDTEEGKR